MPPAGTRALALLLLLAVSLPGSPPTASAAKEKARKEKTLPQSWKLCRKEDPQVDTCLLSAINEAIEALSFKGLRDLEVPPLDPFLMSEMFISQGNGPVSGALILKNISITGLANLRCKSIQADLKNYNILGSLKTIPSVSFLGNYAVKGRVLVLPITGEGKCKFVFKNITPSFKFAAKEIKQNGQIYLNVTEINFTLEPERLFIYMENLLNGNKQLGEQINKVLDENWALILKELNQPIEEAFGLALTDYANRILLKVPLEKLFSH